MSAFIRRAFMSAVLACIGSNAAAVDFGRTAGSFSVSPSGAASYTIPLWTPPGPNGMTPSLSLSYSSQSGNGLAGVGWNLNAVSAIERCARTKHQDGSAAPVDLTWDDRYCINGSRLRLGSGAYGAAGSVYFTEIADFSRITAYGALGNGPQSFLVESKDGLKYEYGATTSSRVVLGTTVLRWMLNKVYDRSGNNYVVVYNNATGFAMPDVISWTPTYWGSPNYRYEAKFNYTTTRIDEDAYLGKIAGLDVANRYLLSNVQIKSAGTVVRKYRFSYAASGVTSRSLLTSAKECADDLEANCFLPLTLGYQAGQTGTTSTPASGLSSTSSLYAGKYDFNGDGKSDLLHVSGVTWKVAFSTGTGFGTPVDTGVASSVTPLVQRFLATHQDGLLVNVSGVWTYVGYNGSTFASTSTGIPVPTGYVSGGEPKVTDNDGDGLADLLWTINGSVMLRLNTTSAAATVPNFGSAIVAASFTVGRGNVAIIDAQKCPMERMCDVNGDRRADLIANVTFVPTTCGGPGGGGGCNATYSQFDLLAIGAGYNAVPLSGPIGYTGIKFNDDGCVDRIPNTAPLTLQISGCNSAAPTTVALPASGLFLDWNGDGRSDILVNNGGFYGAYLSKGNSASPFTSLVPTTVPVSTSCTTFVFDVDGDGFDDIGCVGTTSPYAVSFYTHNGSGGSFLTQQADLLNSITDGYGVNISPWYVSTAQNNYTHGVGTQLPLVDATAPIVVVAQVTRSNGIGGSFNQTYAYLGARNSAERGEFAGFQRVDEIDSRNGLISRTYFDQSFPKAGLVNQTEVMQPNGVTTISREVTTNLSTALDATANNQRYFVYPSNSTMTQYEVGGTWNGALLRTVTVANTFETAGGALYDQTVTTTEPASGANGVSAGGSWVARTYLPLANMLNDTTNWCIGRPGQVQQINSHNLPSYGTAITRTTNVTWNAPNCRPTQTVAEPGSGTLQVTTDIGYDGFGNVSSTTVTGVGMTARTSAASYSDATYTTGQFPLSTTNALGQSSAMAWNFDLSVPLSATDSNGLMTSWHYDAFGRRDAETRPDGTSSTVLYRDCAVTGYCPGFVRTQTIASEYDNAATLVGRVSTNRDSFDRTVERYQRSRDWISTNTNVEYDALGRVYRSSAPCFASGAGCATFYWTTNTYDLVNRVIAVSRPISDTTPTLETTTIYYEGLTSRVKDPQDKYSYKTADAAGHLVRSQDHDGYYQNFEYDAFGNAKRVLDSAGNTLQTSSYNLRGMPTDRTDMDMGAWVYDPNALGEVVHLRDAKTLAPAWTQTLAYDTLGRLTSRTESEGASTWTWGASGAAKNIGQLASVSGPGYSESYTYDSLARVSSATVSADTTYQIDYTYNSMGAVDTLTYPTSTSSYRLKLQYEYLFGHLHSIKDYNAPSTVFWAANAGNPRDQIVQETLGNGLVTNRAFDAVTGWVKTIQTGMSGGSAVQNLAYTWDLAGNLATRKDVNQSNLTETFTYDNLHRLSTSSLSTTGTNLTMGYDALGNITSKSDVGTYTYDPGKKHQVTSTNNGWTFGYDNNGNMTSGRGAAMSWTSYNYPAAITNGSDSSAFSYTPDRQYWKQVSNYASGGAATTIYVRDLLEKVTTSAGTDYRHLIRAGNSTVVVSRLSSGTNSVRYLTSDYLGSSSAITNSSGGILVNSSFDAFGRRRGSNWSGSPSAGDWAEIASSTRRGYTDHTMLDNLNLTHMNGRVYDQVLGRFLSADPYVTAPLNTQDFNRYSYVYNNPLSATDPSGFEDCREGSLCQPDDLQQVVIEGYRGCNSLCQGTQDQMRNDAAAFAFASESSRQQNVGQILNQGSVGNGGPSLGDSVPAPAVDPENPEGLEVVEVCGDCSDLTFEVKQAWESFVSWSCLDCQLPGDGWDATLNGLGPEFGIFGAIGKEITAARGGAAVVRAGQAGEKAVRAVANIGPKTAIDIAGRTRIPDGLLPGVLSEVKNVGSLSFTQQLRDFTQFSLDKGLRFDLYVRPGAQLSGPLLDARVQGLINILEIPFP